MGRRRLNNETVTHRRFYVQQGLSANAYTYNVITQAMSFVACLFTIFFLDKIGRRPILIVGAFLQVSHVVIKSSR